MPLSDTYIQLLKEALSVQNGKKSSKVANTLSESITTSELKHLISTINESSTKQRILNILKEVRIQESETNPIAKQFTVDDDYEKYVKKYIGQPFLAKELEALHTFQGAKPQKVDRTEIRFETSDEFGNTNTIVIKKLKDSGQFSFNAFSKHEQVNDSEDETQEPAVTEPTAPIDSSTPTPDPTSQDTKDEITISKSLLFKDDIKGGSILSDFLKKLAI